MYNNNGSVRNRFRTLDTGRLYHQLADFVPSGDPFLGFVAKNNSTENYYEQTNRKRHSIKSCFDTQTGLKLGLFSDYWTSPVEAEWLKRRNPTEETDTNRPVGNHLRNVPLPLEQDCQPVNSQLWATESCRIRIGLLLVMNHSHFGLASCIHWYFLHDRLSKLIHSVWNLSCCFCHLCPGWRYPSPISTRLWK